MWFGNAFIFLAIIFTLEQPSYTITESNNTLSVCVGLIQGQLAREVSFNLSYQHITTEGKDESEHVATSLKNVKNVYFSASYSDEDFSPQASNLTFLPDTNRMCIDIDIIDDSQLEDDEQFSVEISTDDRVDIGLPISTVTIRDDDGMIITYFHVLK